MAKYVSRLLLLAAFLLMGAGIVWAQVAPTGALHGTVTDPTGAVVVGAEIKVRDEATGVVLESKSNQEGRFVLANLTVGTYTVTVAVEGFKTAEYRAVKIVVGGVYDLVVRLEVGDIRSTLVVEAGAEVLQTASTAVGTTIMGKAVTQLPFTSRDALDLGLVMPGAQTAGRPRETSFLGLPKGTINITLDGINVQDNYLRSSDGYFTRVRPRIDMVEEFSISTAAHGAEQAGEGAVQIRFETKRGGSEYRGGLWWYHRNDIFNSNYYFNNQVAPGQASVARQRMRLNQYGYKIGGPILKERLFFFHDFDFFSKPESRSRSATLLTTDSMAGRFVYGVSTVPTIPPTNTWTTCMASDPRNNNSPACTVDLFALAAARGAAGVPNTFDDDVMAVLTAMDGAYTAPGVTLAPFSVPWTNTIRFNNVGTGNRMFPDLRLDWNITKNLAWSGVYHYNLFDSDPDFLNGRDANIPVEPFSKSTGNQISSRHAWVLALRWNVTPQMSNEVRGGMSYGRTDFALNLDPSFNQSITNNLGSILTNVDYPVVTDPVETYSPSTRNPPLTQLMDNLSWTRGKHTFAFGFSLSEQRFNQSLFSRRAHTVTIGMVAADANSGIFSSTNLPGSSTSARTAASSLYALLTGRVSGYSGTISVDEDEREFAPGAPLTRRLKQTEFGFYGTDSWRATKTLTVNYGLRWEYQGGPEDPKDISFRPVGGYAGLFGVSGLGNLFKPGTLTGSITAFELNGKDLWYEKDLNNFAPSLGLAWQPGYDNKWWNWIFGGPGKSVFRAGYSINFSREGIANFTDITFANPGANGSISSAAVTPPAGPCPAGPFTTAGSFPAGCVTLSAVYAGQLQSLKVDPPSFLPTFQMTAFAGQSANMYDPNLEIPMVQSWSVGIQRELTPNMVFEIRYVGNHGTGLWRQYNLNEVNIFENGFLEEFLNAQNNLKLCRANSATCIAAQAAGGVPSASRSGENYAYWGLTGQVRLPIMTAAFTGSTTGAQSNSNFYSGSRITQLDNGVSGAFANTLSTSSSFTCNLVGTAALPGTACPTTAPVTGAYPANFFVVNPQGSSYTIANDTHSTYNGLQIEVRRRPSRGLMFNGNYTFSKSLSNLFGDESSNLVNFSTLRLRELNKAPSPWDIRHAFKLQLIYELPFGPGRKWSSEHGWLNRLIEGWEFNSITRWQSGRVFRLSSGLGGTFTQYEPDVRLVGISYDQLKSMIKITKMPDGRVFYFHGSMIDAATGMANKSFVMPCDTPGKYCQRVFLYGPSFFRPDWSLSKRTRITERINVEFRAEFLNIFNNINFFFPGGETTTAGSADVSSTTFGRITNAYQDYSTTDDPGGRIIQMVLRVNF